MTLTLGQAQRGAYASGYDARCAGRTRWTNPYNDRLDRHEGRPGWLGSLAAAWLDGWLAADAALAPIPDPPRPRRRRAPA